MGNRQSWTQTALLWLVQLLVVFLVAGEPAPGVNESHYLTKARHYFDGEFAPGDLFLESHNSHLASTLVAGLLSTFLPLAAVAWIGRLVCWGFLSWAWLQFTRSLRLPSLLQPLSFAAWYYAVFYGHWAGEWAVGGFEGKALAYPCVLVALSYLMRDRLTFAWLWLGGAVVWHPLVGGWAGLSVGLFWLLGLRCKGLHKQLPYLLLAAGLGVLGVLPALTGIGGEDRLGNVVASQVHVYFRLSHHLCALAFDPVRHERAGLSFVLFILASGLWLVARKRGAGGYDPVAHSGQQSECSLEPSVASGRLLAVAWFSVLFALLGLGIDALLSLPSSPGYDPLLGSKLLRFYWFRWSDIAVPLAWTAVYCQVAAQWGWTSAKADSVSISSLPVARSTVTRPLGIGMLVAGVIAVLVCAGNTVVNTWNESLPPADRMLVNGSGFQREIEWDSAVEILEDPKEQQERTRGVAEPVDASQQRLREWRAVCAWIRQNTPTDSLWLTPRNQQTFKWYANRAEVVCWKDVPQDNESVLEWFYRVQMLEMPRDSQGRSRFWNDEELRGLQEEFDFEYVLLDKTFLPPNEVPFLEILYPSQELDNRSFAVFRMP